MNLTRESNPQGDVRYVITLTTTDLLNMPQYMLKQLEQGEHMPISGNILPLYQAAVYAELLMQLLNKPEPSPEEQLETQLATLANDNEPLTDILTNLGHKGPGEPT